MSITARSLIASFNGGVLSPLLDARVDAGAYKNGCRVLENFVVRPYGGAFKRPGTEYGGAVKTAGKRTRLIAFKRSTNTNYILEFGDQYIRFWTGGSSMTQITSGGAYEVATPYLEADLFALQVCQINDVMFIAHPSYAPRRLSYTSATSWTLEAVTWDFPPMRDVEDTTTTITLQPNVSDWAASTAYVVGNVRIYQTALYMCSTAHTSGGSFDSTKWTAVSARGPWMRSNNYNPGHMVKVGSSYYVCYAQSANAAESTKPGVGASWATYWKLVTLLSGSQLRVFSSAAEFSSQDVGSQRRVDIGANQSNLLLVAGGFSSFDSYTTEPIFLQGDVNVRSNFTSGGGTALGELFLETSEEGTSFQAARQWKFQSTTDSNINASYEGKPTGQFYRMRWEAANSPGAIDTGFVVEAVNSIINGLITIDSYVSTTEVLATFSLANVSLVPCELLNRPTVLWYKPAFYLGRYPRAVALHDSRLFWAGVSDLPSRLWGSRIDDYYNFLTGANDDDGLDLTLAATEANQIEWITSFNKSLICGTTGEEWTINTGDTDKVLTPTSAIARRRTRHGSYAIPPQIVTDALLWVARGGRRIHEFSYDFTSDSFRAPDMTQLAEHVTAGGIVQTAYSADPDGVLWAVSGDGVLLGLTYDRAQQITAWHRHTTAGTFESVAAIYGTSGRDEVWFVVNRTVNGSTVRYIERFYPTAQNYNFDTATDLFYVDCGKKISQASSTTVSGLSHLEGKAVSVVADGARIESKTVASGAITLGTAATSVIVGLPYTSTVQTMKQEVLLQDGTAQGRKFRAPYVMLRMHKSYGGQYADTLGGTAEDIDARTPYEIEQATTLSAALLTREVKQHIQADWSGAVDFNVTHDDPLPFNLLAYVLIYEVEGR